MTGPGHVMGSANLCSQRRPSKDFCAGANAGVRADMVIEATDPLSELVWSPHTGLRLKFTNWSFAERNPITLPRIIEPETIMILPVQTIETVNSNDNASSVDVNLGSIPMIKKSVPEDSSRIGFKSPSTASIAPVCMLTVNSGDPEDDQYAEKNKCVYPLKGMVPTLPKKVSISGPQIDKSANLLLVASAEPKHNLILGESKCVDVNGETGSEPSVKSEEIGKGKNVTSDLAVKQHVKPPKSTSPILRPSNCYDAMPISVIEEDRKSKAGSRVCLPEQNSTMLLKDIEDPHIDDFHDECGSPVYGKDKEKTALSDGDVRISESEKDDNHESVESSNSRRLFKRACSFEQQPIIEHKKIKKFNDDSPSSASFFKHDSSFFSWISNMTNKLPKYHPDETPLFSYPEKSLLGRPGNQEFQFGSHDTKHSYGGYGNIGFQNMFKAMWSPSPKVQNPKVQNKKVGGFEHQIGAISSKELDKVNERCHDYYNRDHDDGDVKLNNFSCENLMQETPKNNSGECSYSCKRASKLGFVDLNKSSNSLSNNPLSESLWVTRFSQKFSFPISKYVGCDYDAACKALSCSQKGILAIAKPKKYDCQHEPSVEDQVDAMGRKLYTHSINLAGTFGYKKSCKNGEQKFQGELNHILPSESSTGHRDFCNSHETNLELLKNLKAMRSINSRRLGTLKHTVPAKITVVTCSFCGVRGHSLRECSEIIESEREALLKTIDLYSRMEESACFCIRCFQIDHWAIACPDACSRMQGDSDSGASLVNHKDLDRMNIHTRTQTLITNANTKKTPNSETKDARCYSIDACAIFLGQNLRKDKEPMACEHSNNDIMETVNLNGKVSDLRPIKNDLVLRGNWYQGAARKRQADSSFVKAKLKVNQTASHNFVDRQIIAVPKGTFETVRRLRLSRSDILRWMRSSYSSFHFEGFFLRVQLGKWEKELGGTGYHVACIIGECQEKLCATCRFPLFVRLGGIKCLVDCRYVSNHDFIEEELIAWWSMTLRGHGKLPSDEELNSKLKEKQRWGI